VAGLRHIVHKMATVTCGPPSQHRPATPAILTRTYCMLGRFQPGLKVISPVLERMTDSGSKCTIAEYYLSSLLASRSAPPPPAITDI
jgi:hypothetical protein